MQKSFETRFMPNVKFKIPTECIKQFYFDLSYPAYAVTSIEGDSLSHIYCENERDLFNRANSSLVSIYEAMPELIPDGMRYNKELDKLVLDVINVEFEKVLSVSENGDITEKEIKINLSEDEKNMLDSLRNSGKSFLDIIKIIKNTDTFTPSYYGAKCKCGEKLDAYAICDKYANKHKPSAWHHAVKKLIRAGDGHKPLLKDIDEVIDSLKRWKEQLNAK